MRFCEIEPGFLVSTRKTTKIVIQPALRRDSSGALGHGSEGFVRQRNQPVHVNKP